MSSPLLRKHLFISFLILVFWFSSESIAWGHEMGMEVKRYLKHAIPFIGVGAFIGPLLYKKKHPIISSIAGVLVGIGISNIVTFILVDDLLSFYMASIILFIPAIVIGLIVGKLFHLFRK